MEFQEDLQGAKQGYMLEHMKFHAINLNLCNFGRVRALAGLNPSSIKFLFSTSRNKLFIKQMVENIRVGFRQLSQTLRGSLIKLDIYYLMS